MRHKPNNPLHKRDWLIADCVFAKARRMVAEHHYAHGGSNTFVALHGLYRRSNYELCGVAWWLPPTRDAVAKHWPNPEAVLTLSRLVIVPGVPTNAATFLMRRSIKLLDPRWELLLTYADPSQGHEGQIYRGSGWEYNGLSKAERVYFIGEQMVSRKCGPTTRTHEEMLALGAVCKGRVSKHRFKIVRRAVKRRMVAQPAQETMFEQHSE